MTILLFTILLIRFRKWKARRQLKKQEALNSRGVGLRTTVFRVDKEGYPLTDYIQLCILARLRINGKIVYRKVHTLLKNGSVPKPGDKIHIRYNPFHPRAVLLDEFSIN